MGGGKSLANLGKILLSAIVVSAVILGENSLAKTQKSSKKGLRSASSKNATSSSTKSSKRSGSSQKANVSVTRSSKRASAKSISRKPITNTSISSENTSRVSCNCPDTNSNIFIEDVPVCDNGFMSFSDNIIFGNIFKNKTTTLKEGNFYKLSDLINLSKMKDYVSFSFRYSDCGMKLITENQMNDMNVQKAIANAQIRANGNNNSVKSDIINKFKNSPKYVYGFEPDGDNPNDGGHFCKDVSANEEYYLGNKSILKSDLDKYYFYVDNGASYCPSGLNGIYATFSYDGDDEMIQEEFDNWYENNTKVKKDSDGGEIELDPVSDFSYIKFTK